MTGPWESDSRRHTGRLPMVGSLNSVDSFGTTLTGSHPFSLVLPLKDAANLVVVAGVAGQDG